MIGRVFVSATVLACLLVCPFSAVAQAVTPEQSQTAKKELNKVTSPDALQDQQRAFAISLLMALGKEAPAYSDLALRPRILARTADMVWSSDQSLAQTFFRRAWEAAESGDAEDVTAKKDGAPAMVVALRRMGGRDLRAEVLNLVARRDPVLAQEFLSKLKSDADRDKSKVPSQASDGWNISEIASKRLLAATQLLNEGEIERAIEFAKPALNEVSAASIGFLTDLRAKSPAVADQSFAMLMARAELDTAADANTVSGLSTYVFSPGFYITYSPDGSAYWSQPDNPAAAPDLPPALRNQFFKVAGGILLRPLPPPEQDFSSCGRRGKYLVIKRLLPLFDQYAPDTAVALHAQMRALAGDSATSNDRFTLNDSKASNTATDVLEKMQYELDHAKTTKERDEILAAAAVKLALKADGRSRDTADKIDDAKRREKIRQFVDFEFIRAAIQKKDTAEATRLIAGAQINNTQRGWSYTQVARLLPISERDRILEFLDQALATIQRIDDNPRDRAVLLSDVAGRFFAIDHARTWDTANELVKAANNAENFTGDNVITFSIATRSDIKFQQIGGEEADLTRLFQLLAKDDLYRSVEVAKGFKNDAPRAGAVLAIASALLEPRTLKH